MGVYWGYKGVKPEDLTPEEKAFFKAGQDWQMKEGAYALEQGTKPHTLAASLADSPSGMAAWMLEKWNTWTDGGLDVYDPDDVLTALTIQWVAVSLASSIQMYAETQADPMMKDLGRSEVPAGVLIMPKDLSRPPRVWGERWMNIKHWTEAPDGGHFPSIERSALLARDIRETFDAIAGG